MDALTPETLQKIELLAKQTIREDQRPDEVIIEGTQPIIGELLTILENALNDDLRLKYRPYADRFLILSVSPAGSGQGI